MPAAAIKISTCWRQHVDIFIAAAGTHQLAFVLHKLRRIHHDNVKLLTLIAIFTQQFEDVVANEFGFAQQVVSVDTSQEALDVAKQNVELNKLDLSKAEFIRDDVFKLLRKYRDQGEKFEAFVLHKLRRIHHDNVKLLTLIAIFTQQFEDVVANEFGFAQIQLVQLDVLFCHIQRLRYRL